MNNTTEQGDGQLPCVLCLVRFGIVRAASCGPDSLYCASCWKECGGDVRFTAEFFDDFRPSDVTLN
jgi:hypothetical protein